MEEIAGIVGPVATTIAACMTAANLGPRVTGWGFVVFTVGGIAWAIVGLATGQANLVWQNAILIVIDLIGVWRWLGREARWAEGAQRVGEASRRAPSPELFPARLLAGCPVRGRDGEVIAGTVDAMIACADGRVRFVVVREGGVGGLGERLHAIEWRELAASHDGLSATLDAADLAARADLAPEDWRGAVR